jgi:hypothetical protein
MWCVLTHTWIMHLSLRYKDRIQLYIISYISVKLFSKLHHLASYVFAIMPWPMTLTPMDEAVECENHAKKPTQRKTITVMIQEVMQDVRIVLLSKSFRF